MRLLSKALELLGLVAVAIGITVGMADAHGDIHCDACTDVPTSADIPVTEEAGSIASINLMVDPNTAENSE